MGSKKKDVVLVLVGGGVSALPPPFLKDDSNSTWIRMEEKRPRLPHALREGFLPAKRGAKATKEGERTKGQTRTDGTRHKIGNHQRRTGRRELSK